MATKQAMLRDLGSRDIEFVQTIKDIRAKLLDIAGVASPECDTFERNTCTPVSNFEFIALGTPHIHNHFQL